MAFGNSDALTALRTAAYKLPLIIVAFVAPAYLLIGVMEYAAFFVVASLAVLLGALILWWSGTPARRSGRVYYFLAFTLALLFLIWEPMFTLHAQYAPESVRFLVHNLSYGIAGLVAIGLLFQRQSVPRSLF